MGKIVIKNEREMNKTEFEELELGTVFRMSGVEDLYIKIDPFEHRHVAKFNCLSFAKFQLCWVDPGEDVYVLPAELIIK